MNDSAPVPLSAIRFLKVTEVASMLRVSRMSVYRLIHAGELEAVRFGRNFRVPEHAVDAYLRQSFSTPAEAPVPAISLLGRAVGKLKKLAG